MVVCDIAALTVNAHKAGSISRLHRRLCDKLFGQIIVKVRTEHILRVYLGGDNNVGRGFQL